MGKNRISTLLMKFLLLYPNIIFLFRKDNNWNIDSSFISKTSNRFQETNKRKLSCWTETHNHEAVFLLEPELFDIWSLPPDGPSSSYLGYFQYSKLFMSFHSYKIVPSLFIEQSNAPPLQKKKNFNDSLIN